MAHLAGFLPDVAISTSADYGIDVDAKEAIAFACWRTKPGAGTAQSAIGNRGAPRGGAGEYHAVRAAQSGA